MSIDPTKQRVFEEAVITVLGEDLQPQYCVRKANGDGKISVYKMQLVGFDDMKVMLESLSQEPLIIAGTSHTLVARGGSGSSGSGSPSISPTV